MTSQKPILIPETTIIFSKFAACLKFSVGNLMPCPFTSRKMFCTGPYFLSQPKDLTAFSASSKTFVLAQKNNFTECKSSVCLAQNICDCHNM